MGTVDQKPNEQIDEGKWEKVQTLRVQFNSLALTEAWQKLLEEKKIVIHCWQLT